jgi:hypothetical protein
VAERTERFISPCIFRETDLCQALQPKVRQHKADGYGTVFVGRPEGRRPLARPRRLWEDDTKIYLEELGWRSMDWLYLAQETNGLL